MAKEYYLSDVNDIVLSDTLLTFSRPGLAAEQWSAFKKGHTPWDVTLDIQHQTPEAARKALAHFINLHAQNHESCVLIKHGKQSNQGRPPLIKNLLNQWLKEFPEVLAFASAQSKDGGAASVYVLLKKIHHPDVIDSTPVGRRKDSFLVAETKAMERMRRLAEQQGERQLGPVNAREHSIDEARHNSPEGEPQNNILQHPELNNQRFDGVDPNLNPEPPLNTDARREFDNEKRDQEMEKQLRLGNMPKFSSAPTPKGP